MAAQTLMASKVLLLLALLVALPLSDPSRILVIRLGSSECPDRILLKISVIIHVVGKVC